MIQERIPQRVYQLRITADQPQPLKLAAAVLLNVGFAQSQLTTTLIKGQETIEIFDEQRPKLDKIKKFFVKLKLPGLHVQLKQLAPKDWLTRWKLQWKPAPLTRKIDVVPVWYQDQYKPKRGRDIILMDTLLSFGTGLHETTQFMAQIIEDRRGDFKSFLDIGTGTGILCFVAHKNGAKDLLGLDIGELSIQACRDNMKVNQIPFKAVEADIRKFKLKKQFDFVAANLITGDLIENAKRITGFVKAGGFLAVSGISLENLDRLRKSFSVLPLKVLQIKKGRQWSALLYQKVMS